MNTIGENLIGKQVIVRSNLAGVFFGTLVSKIGTEIELKEARKLRYWSGANGLEQLSLEGVRYPQKCQFTMAVDVVINTYEQLLECTEKAIESIKNVEVWKI